MPAVRHRHPSLRAGRPVCIALVIAVAALAVAAPTSLASTGSVYWDTNGNAAAGNVLFNGTFTGLSNVGLGESVMPNLTNGLWNVAVGDTALAGVNTGSRNVATGYSALSGNTTGHDNIASGSEALVSNNGDRNIGIGSLAL